MSDRKTPAAGGQPPASGHHHKAGSGTSGTSGPAAPLSPGAPDIPVTSVDDLLARLRATTDDAPAGDPAGAGTPTDDGADALAQAEAVVNEAADEMGLQQLVAERTNDLQRVQAEYANYRKRVERDRAQARQQGAEQVIRELMPVLDAIRQASDHEELTGGLKVIAGELTRIAEKLGLVSFGVVGDEFDPNMHEALMQLPADGVEPGHITQVIQPGYRLGETVLRPARVAVAPAEE